MDLSYGNMAANFGQNNVVSSTGYAVFWRSASYVSASSSSSTIRRNGTVVAATGLGLSIVAIDETSAVPTYTNRGVFVVGDGASESLLVTFINDLPTDMLVRVGRAVVVAALRLTLVVLLCCLVSSSPSLTSLLSLSGCAGRRIPCW